MGTKEIVDVGLVRAVPSYEIGSWFQDEARDENEQGENTNEEPTTGILAIVTRWHDRIANYPIVLDSDYELRQRCTELREATLVWRFLFKQLGSDSVHLVEALANLGGAFLIDMGVVAESIIRDALAQLSAWIDSLSD